MDDIIEFYKGLMTPVVETYDSTGMRALLIKDIPEPQQSPNLDPDEMLFGFSTIVYTPQNMVKLKLDWNSPLFLLILGQPRIGKGVAGSYFAERLFFKTGAKIMSLDSAHELFTHRFPYAHTETDTMQRNIDAWNSQWGPTYKRRGFKMFQVAPKFYGSQVMNVDKQFAYSYSQFKILNSYNPTEAKSILTEMIAGDSGTAAQVLISRALNDESINSWQLFYNKLLEYRKGVKQDDPLKSRVTTVFQGLQDCLENKYLSDDESDHLDILKVVRENEWINFLGQLRSVEDDNNATARYNAFVKMFFSFPIQNLVRYHQGASDAFLKNLTIYVPELDSATPKSGTSSLRQMFTSFILKYGKMHLNSIMDVQDSDKIEPSIAKNSSILTGKATGGNLNVLESKGLTDIALEMIKTAPTKQPTSVGTKASLFFFVGRKVGEADTVPTYGYMPWPVSEIFDEKKYAQV